MEDLSSEVECGDVNSQLGTAGLVYVVFNRSLYPYGIPLSILESGKTSQKITVPARKQADGIIDSSEIWGKTTAELIIIAQIDEVGPPFSGIKGNLLKNIIEKGLKKNLNNVCILAVKNYMSDKIAQFVNLSDTKTLLIFDPELAYSCLAMPGMVRGQIQKHADKNILVTHSLKDIIEHSLFKKEAWQDLQQI